MARGVSSTSTVILYFLAIVLPPVAVFLDSAFSVDFLINICLTILGWIPGILHAWYVISKRERVPAAATANPPVAGETTAPAPAPAPAAAAPATTAAPTAAAAKY